MKSTKKALFMSCLSLLLCVSMLVGTTFAWFTDSVTSGVNQIIAGNLDVELWHTSKTQTEEQEITDGSTNLLFQDITLWEPGAFVYETFTVKNVGTLALKYKMNLNVVGKNTLTTNDVPHDLTEVVKVAVSDTVPATREAAAALPGYTSLDSWAMNATENLYPAGGTAASAKSFTVVLYWEPTDHDNDYNANNGQHTSDNEPLQVKLGVNLFATQVEHEDDSFGNDYDASTALPTDVVAKGSLKVSNDSTANNATVAEETILSDAANKMTVTYPAGVKLNNTGAVTGEEDDKTTDVQQKFEYKSDTASSAMGDITIADGKNVASYELTLPVDQNNIVPVTVTVDFTPNLSGVQIYHSGDELTATPNANGESAVYNPAGSLTLTLMHASPIDVVYDATPCAHVYENGSCIKCNAADPSITVITTQAELEAAVKAANDGDKIYLGEGEFTTYGISDVKNTGKDLTFVGQGADKTTWKYGKSTAVSGEGGSDYSFDGAGHITFKNLTLQDNIDVNSYYRGFVRANGMTFENCTIKNMLGYLGTGDVHFTNCLFDTSTVGEYNVKAYSGKDFYFDGCTFNGSKGFIQAYMQDSSATVHKMVVNNCTFVKGANTARTPVYFYDQGATEGAVWDIQFTGNNVNKDNALSEHSTSGSWLWGDMKYQTSATAKVSVNGVTVWENNTKVG